MYRLTRERSGYNIAEMPVAVFVFLLVLAYPLLDLGAITLRSTSVYMAAKNGVHAAARAQSFQQDTSAEKLSSVNIAKQAVRQAIRHGIAGVEVADSDVVTSIIGTPLKPALTAIESTSPLASAEPGDYLYQIQVLVVGRVQPLITMNKDLFGSIPGITEPVIIRASFRELAEHPDGLTK